MLERLEDLDLSLKVPYVLGGAVLEFLHGHDLSCVVLQWVIAAHLHTAKVSLQQQTSRSEMLLFKLLQLQM